MDVIAAYREVGSYRGAAAICGTTHKTVKRIIERATSAGGAWRRRASAARAQLRRGRRPGRREGREDRGPDLGEAAAAGGPGRGLCGVGAELPPAGRGREAGVAAGQARTGGRRPAVWTPGETLVIDWGVPGGGLHVFCAVLAWSRFRFVRFAADEKAATTLALLAECFEVLGGVPEGRAGRPDGLPEGRRGRQRGGPDRRTMSGSPPTTGSGPTSARPPTRSPRGSWRTWSATPSAT